MYKSKTNIFWRILKPEINSLGKSEETSLCPLFQPVQYSNMGVNIPFGPGGPGRPMPGIPGSPFAPGMPDKPRWPGWPGSPVKRSSYQAIKNQNKKLFELPGYLVVALPGRPGSPFLPGGPGGPGTPGSVIVWPGSPFGPNTKKKQYVSLRRSFLSVLFWAEKDASHILSWQSTPTPATLSPTGYPPLSPIQHL